MDNTLTRLIKSFMNRTSKIRTEDKINLILAAIIIAVGMILIII